MAMKKFVLSAQYEDFFSFAVIFGLPIVLFSTLPNILIQAGLIDPYLYTGYIFNYEELVQRYGRTYYSTRIAFLYPDKFFVYLFGEYWGYILFRYFVLVAGTAVTYRIARSFYTRQVATTAAVWFVFNPWTIRTLTHDYYDGTAIAYLLSAIYCSIIPTRRQYLGSLAAGMFVALAINCNLVLTAVSGLFFPCWMIVHRDAGTRRRIAMLGAMIAAFVATSAVLGLLLHLRFPQQSSFLESTALSQALSLLGGGVAAWFYPLGPYLAGGNYYIVIPLTLWLAAALLWVILRSHRQRPVSLLYPVALTYLGLVGLLLLAM